MSPATAPCARAPGVAMRAPGSQCIFTVLAISGGRGPLAGWLAGWLAENPSHMHAGSPECMQAARAACMNSEKWLPASQPFCGPRMADMARTVKMHMLPGARMPPPGARAQGAVAGDILGTVRARARVSRSKFRESQIWQPPPRGWLAGSMTENRIHLHEVRVGCS